MPAVDCCREFKAGALDPEALYMYGFTCGARAVRRAFSSLFLRRENRFMDEGMADGYFRATSYGCDDNLNRSFRSRDTVCRNCPDSCPRGTACRLLPTKRLVVERVLGQESYKYRNKEKKKKGILKKEIHIL